MNPKKKEHPWRTLAASGKPLPSRANPNTKKFRETRQEAAWAAKSGPVEARVMSAEELEEADKRALEKWKARGGLTSPVSFKQGRSPGSSGLQGSHN